MRDIREWDGDGQGREPKPSDTIFALASGRGVAGLSVVRISGPSAEECLLKLTGKPLPVARRATVRRLLDADGCLLDEALVLRFERNASFTGEPVVELHCHGSAAVRHRLISLLSAIPNCRIADPGEFTRRAFESGRINLLEVEALGDLLAAETEKQRQQAVRRLEGEFERLVGTWRERLVEALALIEVTVDWADEDVPEEVPSQAMISVREVREEMRVELAGADAAERLRTGLEIALVGPPNAGKSSLLNALARRTAAIVSPTPGTTRDVIELRYDLNGFAVTFLDTAGLRHARDDIEAIGIEHARARALRADLRLFLCPPEEIPAFPIEDLRQEHDLDVLTKADLRDDGQGVSAITGTGLSELLERIGDRVASRVSECSIVSHVRQRRAIEDAVRDLEEFDGNMNNFEAELLAEHLRRALRSLDRLIGRVDADHILDAVFQNFCLGK